MFASIVKKNNLTVVFKLLLLKPDILLQWMTYWKGNFAFTTNSRTLVRSVPRAVLPAAWTTNSLFAEILQSMYVVVRGISWLFWNVDHHTYKLYCSYYFFFARWSNYRLHRRHDKSQIPSSSSTTDIPACYSSSYRGKGFHYAIEFRLFAVLKRLMRGEDAKTLLLWQMRRYLVDRTICWYFRQLAIHGHLLPFRRTGNRQATVLWGYELYLLVLYRYAFPKAQIAQMSAFLFNATGGARFYSPSQISEAETWIGMSQKKGFTMSGQLFSNLQYIQKQ